MKACLGFDIGGSHLKYALGNREPGLLYSSSIPTPTDSLSSFKAAFRQILASVYAQYPGLVLDAVGIGTPGTIDLHQRQLRGVNPNLPFWTGLDPSELIPSELGIPVAFDNDANLMTLAEANSCENQEAVLGITVGTGIGSGFVYQGRIFHGGRGFAMELGHVCMVPDGERCNCGLQGCLEAYSSLSGIRKRVAQLEPGLSVSDPPALLELAEKNRQIEQIIAEGRTQLSRALANAIILLDPDLVVIGGGCMDGGLYSISALESEIRSLLPEVNQHSRISKARLGNQAGVRGAILLAESLISESSERNLH